MLVEPASCCVWRPVAPWAVAASSRSHPIGSSGSRKGSWPVCAVVAELWEAGSLDQAGFAAGVTMEPGWQAALGSRGRARWGTHPQTQSHPTPMSTATFTSNPGSWMPEETDSCYKDDTYGHRDGETCPKITELANGSAEV